MTWTTTRGILLVCLLLVVVVPAFAAEQAYRVPVHAENGTPHLEEVRLTTSRPLNSLGGSGPYRLHVTARNGTTLYSGAFTLEEEVFGHVDGTRLEQADRRVLRVPYQSHGVRITLSDADGVLDVRTVSRFATCDMDRVCDAMESAEQCPADCASRTEEPGIPAVIALAVGAVIGAAYLALSR